MVLRLLLMKREVARCSGDRGDVEEFPLLTTGGLDRLPATGARQPIHGMSAKLNVA